MADSAGIGRDDPAAPFDTDASYLWAQSFDEMAARDGITMHFSG